MPDFTTDPFDSKHVVDVYDSDYRRAWREIDRSGNEAAFATEEGLDILLLGYCGDYDPAEWDLGSIAGEYAQLWDVRGGNVIYRLAPDPEVLGELFERFQRKLRVSWNEHDGTVRALDSAEDVMDYFDEADGLTYTQVSADVFDIGAADPHTLALVVSDGPAA